MRLQMGNCRPQRYPSASRTAPAPTSHRNRPAALQNDPAEVIMAPEVVQGYTALQEAIDSGIAPGLVADTLFAGLAAKQLYILTHPDLNDAIRARADDIAQERNPELG